MTEAVRYGFMDFGKTVRLAGRFYWAGVHRDFGVLVHGPDLARSPSDLDVVLWNANHRTEKRLPLDRLLDASAWIPEKEWKGHKWGYLADRVLSKYIRDGPGLSLSQRPGNASLEKWASCEAYLGLNAVHCFACKKQLKSAGMFRRQSPYPKCPKCSWLQCECGACGCTFRDDLQAGRASGHY